MKSSPPFGLRTGALAVLLLGSALLSEQAAWAQGFRFPFHPSVEAGVGMSRLRWEGEPARVSYLPELTLSFVAPTTFSSSVVLDPKIGLQFDGVRLRSIDDYSDHYAVTSLRTGLSVLLVDDRTVSANRLFVGIGVEARRPIYVRASVYSRTGQDSRDWVRAPDPTVFYRWGFYWAFRIGLARDHRAYFLEGTLDNDGNSLLAMPLPRNPLQYFNLRLGVRVGL